MTTISDRRNGFTVTGVVVALTIVSMMGLAATYLTTTTEKSKIDSFRGNRAYYTAQAGAEFAMRQYYAGVDSVNISSPGKAFENGNFTIQESGAVPNTTVTVTGNFGGEASKTLSFSKPNGGKCLDIDTSAADVISQNDRLTKIYIKKECLGSITVDKMTLSWTPNNGETFTGVDFALLNKFSAPPTKASGELVELPNTTFNNGSPTEVRINFSPGNDMRFKTFTISFTMLDGTVKQAQFTL